MIKGSSVHLAIAEACATGYRYDPSTGAIYSKQSKLMTPHQGGQARYPTVTFQLPMLAKRLGRKSQGFAIHIHKFAAYHLFGEAVFAPGVQIRHLKTMLDVAKGDLALGSGRRNMADIPKEVKLKASRTARATANAARSAALVKLTPAQVEAVKVGARRDASGNLLPLELDRLASKYGVTRKVISGILRGVLYAPKK
jgi:hypothetical protein